MLISDYGELKKYLEYKKLQEKIDKFSKKYKNKKVLIYGAGLLSQVIFDNYDLSGLNITAVCDRKFEWIPTDNFNGYTVICPEQINEHNPDVIFLFVNYTYMIEDFLFEIHDVDYNRIKVERPIPKSFFEKFEDYILTELTV